MKFQATMRMALVLAGFAGALLAPNAARAQQDVDPTIFDVSTVAPLADASATVQTAATVAPAAPEVVQQAAVSSEDAAEASRVTAADNLILIGAAICAGLIALRRISSSKQRALRSTP